MAGVARAQTDYFWNAPTGGAGSWDTSTPDWSTVAAGPVNYTWTNSGNERANFGNTAGTVTLGTNITAFGININTANYIIAGGGNTLTLSGPGGVINSGVAATISAPIAGTVGLTKLGSGTLTLSGANTYTGGTTVTGGNVTGTAQATGSPFSSGPITLNLASLRLNGIPSATTTTVGDLTIGAASATTTGASNLIINNSTTGVTTTLAAGNLVRGGSGSALVITPVSNNLGTGTGTGEVITFTGGNANVNGILPAWVVAGSSATGADFVSYGANGVTTATTANAYFAGDLTTSSSTSVVNQAAPVTLSGSATAYALKTNQVIGLGGNTLTLGNGTGQSGLILNTGASISGGAVSFGPTEGTIFVQGTATLGGAGDTISSNGLTITAVGATTLTLGGNIVNGTQPAKLVLTATSSTTNITLGGANTYSGGTIMSVNTGASGNVFVGSDTAFGTGKVTNILVPGTASPQFQALNGTRTLANAFDLNGGLTFTGTNGFVFSGPINIINAGAGGTRTLNDSIATAGSSIMLGASPGSSTITVGNPVANGGDGIGKGLVLTGATGSTIVINDVIQDPAPGGGAAAANVNIGGTGTVALNSLSTYSGGTLANGAGTIIPISVSSNGLPGPSFTAGPFGTGALTVNNGTNEHLRPIGNQTISNQIIMTTGFAMDTVAGDTTSSLTFAGPITMTTTGRFISNGFGTGTSQGGTMILGAPAAPNTITLPTVTNLTLSIAALWGPIVVNDVIQNAAGTSGNVALNPQANGNGTDAFPITLNAANTYTGNTTLGGAAFANMGPILLGVSSVGSPGSITSGPFGAGTVTTNNTTSPPNLIPFGADRTVANAITMTSGFFASNSPGTSFNLNLTGPISLNASNRALTNNMSGTLTLGSAANPSTLTLGITAGFQLQIQSQTGTGVTIINDVIQDPVPGVPGTVLVSSGTVQMTNANTFSGGVTVAGGRLLVNNASGSGTGTGPVTVTGTGASGSGGTLGGGNAAGTVGFISGNVTISSQVATSQGGTLSPGNSIGTLTATAGSVAWNPLGTYLFEHDASAAGPVAPIGGSTADLLKGAGTAFLDLSGLGNGAGQQFNLVLSPVVFPATLPSQPVTYTIADFSGSTTSPAILPPAGLTGTDLTPYFVVSGAFQPSFTPIVSLTNGNLVQVTFVPVPEPAFILAACGGFTALAAWRRSRRGARRQTVN